MMVSWRYLASDAEDTEYRITTLMQDPQYHNQVVGQNIAYNQPPHASFYLGSDKSLPARPNVTVLGGNRYTPVEEEKVAASLTENGLYMIKNASSGLYMEVANGEAKNGADGAAAHNTWKVQSAAPSDYATALKWLSFFIRPLFESALKTNDALEFAKEHLFSPLEIDVESNIIFQSEDEQKEYYHAKNVNGWVADPNDVNTAGWGLNLKAADMAKLGQLYLNGGVRNGRQLISKDWIKESTRELKICVILVVILQ